MAITVLTSPTTAHPAFVKNPINFSFECSLFVNKPFIWAILQVFDSVANAWVEIYRYKESQFGTQVIPLFIDVSKPLHDYLNRKTYQPNLSIQQEELITNKVVKYKITAGEGDGSINLPTYNTPDYTSPELYAHKGGISWLKHAHAFNFWTALSTDKMFLSWKPNNTVVTTSQPEFVNFYSKTTGTRSVLVKAQTNIGLYTNTLFSFVAQAESVYCLPAGYASLGIAAMIPSGEKLKWYSIQVMNGATAVSVERKYQVDLDAGLFNRYIIFENSLGGFDTLRLTGKFKGAVDNDYQDGLVNYTRSANITVPTQPRLSGSETFKFKGGTGYLSPSELDWLRDLRLARHLYEVRNGLLVPVKPSSKTLSLLDDEKDIHASDLEFTDSFSSNSYTPLSA